MTDAFTPDIPAVANQISADIDSMEQSLGFMYANMCDAEITVGAKDTAGVVNVAIQITGADDSTAVTEAFGFHLYLSSDSLGQTLATAPSTLAVGTDGTILIEHTANLVMLCVSEADGDFDIDITDTASNASFVNVLLPSGKISTSSAISWS